MKAIKPKATTIAHEIPRMFAFEAGDQDELCSLIDSIVDENGWSDDLDCLSENGKQQVWRDAIYLVERGAPDLIADMVQATLERVS